MRRQCCRLSICLTATFLIPDFLPLDVGHRHFYNADDLEHQHHHHCHRRVSRPDGVCPSYVSSPIHHPACALQHSHHHHRHHPNVFHHRKKSQKYPPHQCSEAGSCFVSTNIPCQGGRRLPCQATLLTLPGKGCTSSSSTVCVVQHTVRCSEGGLE